MTTPAPVRLPIVGGWQMTLTLSQNGQAAAIVLGGKHPDGTVMTPETLTGWRDAAWNAFRPLIINSTTCTGAIVRQTIPNGAIHELTAPATPAGSVAATGTVAAGATLLKWATARGGRSGKGRSFVPGLVATAVNADGRTYNAAYLTTANTAISAYLGSAAFSGSGLVPAVLSFTKGEANQITSGALGARVGIQRRRMR